MPHEGSRSPSPTRSPRFASALRVALGAWAILLGLPSLAWALANPASVYCESRGGKVEIETGTEGGQKGYCIFPDGTKVDEWAYFRSSHRTTK